MEEKKPRVRLYVVRNFGQKLSATADFLRENWRVLLKYFTYFLLPVSLVQALGLNGFMDGYVNSLQGISTGVNNENVGMVISFVAGLLGYVGMAMVGGLLLQAIIFALIRFHDESDQPLSLVQWDELKHYFWQGIRRSLILTAIGTGLLLIVFLFLGLLMFALGEIGVIMGVVLFYLMLIILGIAFGPFLMLVSPTYIFRDDFNVLAAMQKALRYSFGTWGGTWAIILVLGFLTNIISGITMMPWYIAEMTKMFLGISNQDTTTFADSYIYGFVVYLLAVVQCFGNYLVSLILYIGSAYCYGHAAEKLDGMTMDDNIKNFQTLA